MNAQAAGGYIGYHAVSDTYEDPAFFRRLFKRTTGLTPGAYRKRFRIPEFARP